MDELSVMMYLSRKIGIVLLGRFENNLEGRARVSSWYATLAIGLENTLEPLVSL